MTYTMKLTGAVLALALAAALPSAGAMAQGSGCAGAGKDVNGTIKTNGTDKPTGADGTCETVVRPDGRVTVQNGPSAGDPGGADAKHEGESGGSK